MSNAGSDAPESAHTVNHMHKYSAHLDGNPFQENEIHSVTDCSVELLAPGLLTAHPQHLAKIDNLRKSLGLDIGWHYALDLLWILDKVSVLQPGSTILDAGGGKGLLQFALAEKGFNVISVDFSKRRLQIPILASYRTEFKKGDLSTGEYLDHMTAKDSGEHPLSSRQMLIFRSALYKVRRFLSALIHLPIFLFKRRGERHEIGRIVFYQSNILHMPDIKDASIDALVSLSAIEHMKKPEIVDALKEFCRVLRPRSLMLITTNATSDDDWYHEPSMAWCFSEQSLLEIFRLKPGCPTNWIEFDTILERIRKSKDLRERLSPSYSLSGKNGMPWGKWDPKYVPVGLSIEFGEGR
jgi:ubiquinone/menaquinone biosynthesis C-methylase UbiE